MLDIRNHKNLGTYLYYVLWPAVWFYAPLRVRVRVLIVVDREVLVVRNWFGPQTWQLPGGGIKIRESVTTAARREILEEIGLLLENQNINQLTNSPVVVPQHGTLYRLHYVLCTLNSKPQLQISNEINDAQWTSVDSLDIPHVVLSKLPTQG